MIGNAQVAKFLSLYNKVAERVESKQGRRNITLFLIYTVPIFDVCFCPVVDVQLEACENAKGRSPLPTRMKQYSYFFRFWVHSKLPFPDGSRQIHIESVRPRSSEAVDSLRLRGSQIQVVHTRSEAPLGWFQWYTCSRVLEKSICWSTGAHGGTVACYRSARAMLEPSRDGEYMVMIMRGYSEDNIKGIVCISKYQKGTVGISI